MNPYLYLFGVVAIVCALGCSLFAIVGTVVPAMAKIRAALQGRGGSWL